MCKHNAAVFLSCLALLIAYGHYLIKKQKKKDNFYPAIFLFCVCVTVHANVPSNVFHSLFVKFMSTMLHDIGQLAIEPAYIGGSGDSAVHEVQGAVRVVLAFQRTVDAVNCLLRYLTAVDRSIQYW